MGVKRKPLVIKLLSHEVYRLAKKKLDDILRDDFEVINARSTGEMFALVRSTDPDAVIVDPSRKNPFICGSQGNNHITGLNILIEAQMRHIPLRVAVVTRNSSDYQLARRQLSSHVLEFGSSKRSINNFCAKLRSLLDAAPLRSSSDIDEQLNSYMYVLMGTSGVGKTTLLNKFIGSIRSTTGRKIALCPKYTTRKPRTYEYPNHFMTEPERIPEFVFAAQDIFDRIKSREGEGFLTYEKYGNSYGISTSMLRKLLGSGRDVILATQSLELMHSLKEKNDSKDRKVVVPVLLNPPLEIILERLEWRDHISGDVRKKADIQKTYGDFQKAVDNGEFAYVLSYDIEHTDPQDSDEVRRKQMINTALLNVASRLAPIFRRTSVKGLGYTYKEMHKSYVDDICSRLFGMPFDDVQKKVNDFGRLPVMFDANRVRIPNLSLEQVTSVLPRYCVSTGISHGRAILVLDEATGGHEEISERYTVLNLLTHHLQPRDGKREDFYYVRRNTSGAYERISRMALCKAKEGDALLNDVLIYSQTDSLDSKSHVDCAQNYRSIVFVFTNSEHVTLTPLTDSEIQKI